jgi:hypothetical protein
VNQSPCPFADGCEPIFVICISNNFKKNKLTAIRRLSKVMHSQ